MSTKEEQHDANIWYIEFSERLQNFQLDLTDKEWMSIVARERDGLPPCCANISSLRDSLIGIAMEDGRINFLTANRFVAALTWCFPSHEVPSDVMEKILKQVDFDPERDQHHVEILSER